METARRYFFHRVVSAAGVMTLFLSVCAHRVAAAPTQLPALVLPSDYSRPRVALTVQGKSEDMQMWMSIYEEMRSKERLTLFLLSYDSPLACPLDIFCYYYPNTTWTTGRNELARKIITTEEESMQKYKYWAFHDADTWDLRCAVCR
jgi:hypothetical protein